MCGPATDGEWGGNVDLREAGAMIDSSNGSLEFLWVLNAEAGLSFSETDINYPGALIRGGLELACQG